MTDFWTALTALWVPLFALGLMWLSACAYVRATTFDPMRSVRRGRKRGQS